MVDASDASNQRDKFKSLGKGGSKEKVILISPSGSVALNSPMTVPIAEFSAMVRLLALISVGAEFAHPMLANRHESRAYMNDLYLLDAGTLARYL